MGKGYTVKMETPKKLKIKLDKLGERRVILGDWEIRLDHYFDGQDFLQISNNKHFFTPKKIKVRENNACIFIEVEKK